MIRIKKPSKELLAHLREIGVLDEPDDSLEVGLASGLDIPTAIVSATPKRIKQKSHPETVFIWIIVVVSFVWEFLKWVNHA